jgi:pimeloyl-ACP methyl ester carboxylesterase
MPTLRVDDTDVLGYDEYGSGPVVVLIHGSPGTSRAWQRVAERLAGRFRVIAPSLPGYGQTTAGPLDVTHAARLIEALIRQTGPPLVVAGHSYGGVVALRLALRNKVRLGALALFEPVAVPILEAIGEAETFARARAILDEYLASVEAEDRLAVRKMVDYWFGAGAFERLPAAMKDFLIAHTGHNARDVRATFRERYSPGSLGGLTMPVLLVCGGRSPDVMRRICEGIASHAPRGALTVLDTADHALTATHPEEVAGMLAKLTEGPAPTGGRLPVSSTASQEASGP